MMRSELGRVHGVRMTETKAMIPCPFHQETRPSCGVNLQENLFAKGHVVPVGFFYCWGCKKKGPWNELAGALGLQQVAKGRQEDVYARRREVRPQVFSELSMDGLLEDLGCTFNKPLAQHNGGKGRWRGFSFSYLIGMDALYALCSTTGEECLVFPVYDISRELIGGFKGWFEKPREGPTFINARGQWVRDEALWPIHKIGRPQTLWLVEGQRDALRLIRLGIPAVCIMGTNNFTEAKADIICGLGVTRVVLMMDGDEAGRKASNSIRKLLVDRVEVKVCKLLEDARRLKMDKIDPMDMPLDLIKSYFKRFGRGERIRTDQRVTEST
jgi:5S rRNA maturation endonuclease (ribonuclease M5)